MFARIWQIRYSILAAALLFTCGVWWGPKIRHILAGEDSPNTVHLAGAADLPKLWADAASSNDAFAVATGPIDQDVEGFYTLDYLTGDLQCAVLNYRTGKFRGLFRTNVIKDLGAGQNPKYLMVTGRISLPRGASPARVAESAVYVLDSNTGNFVVYTLPWRREMASVGAPQAGQLVVLDYGRARESVVVE